MRESIDKFKKGESEELKKLRERFGGWIENEIEKLKTNEKDLEVRQLKERLEAIKVKDLGEPELKMFELFNRFILNKEPEEKFNWKEFQMLHSGAEKEAEAEKDSSNSRIIAINLMSEKLEPLVMRQQQEEENR